MTYEAELRRAADEYVLAVAVIAEVQGLDPRVVALSAMTDAVARLNEVGALGADEEER